VDVLEFSVELSQVASCFPTHTFHFPTHTFHDLSHVLQVLGGEDLIAGSRHDDQVGVKDEDTMNVSADVL